MRNVFAYSVLLICIIIYFASLSEHTTKSIATHRYADTSILRSDKYRFGDLYGMSYLPGHQHPLDMQPVVKIQPCTSGQKSIDLYALCDSYLWSFLAADSFYCNVNKFRYATINDQGRMAVKLDTAMKNVLLIELCERNVNSTLKNNLSYLTSFLQIKEKIDRQSIAQEKPSKETSGFLFNKEINTNLEFNLFDIAIFDRIKEFKAGLNYRLFKRVDKNIVVGPDEKYLLYNQTTDPMMYNSSFHPIQDSEIDGIVADLNKVSSYYKKLGFREVCLSIIPNPVSIVYPDFNKDNYNHVVERIENHPNLKIGVVKVYQDFRKSSTQLYQYSDTHWNWNGANLWLNKFNAWLSSL